MRPFGFLAVAACYAPTAATGVPCAPSGACPAGQRCDPDRAVCVAALDGPDAPAHDAPPVGDAPDGLGPWGPPVRVAFSMANDDDPTLTSDLLVLYFNRGGDIYSTARASVNAPWNPPAIVAELSSEMSESTPDLALDGLTIYFSSNRSGTNEVWSATRASLDSAWSAPVLETALSSPADDAAGGLRPDGLEILVVSRRDGADYDLYHSTRPTKTAAWSTPQPLTELASPYDEESAFFSDALTVYFDANPTGGVLAFDLYVARRPTPSAPFSAPQRITELSTPLRDHDPWVSPDGHHMFFASFTTGELQLYETSR